MRVPNFVVVACAIASMALEGPSATQQPTPPVGPLAAEAVPLKPANVLAEPFISGGIDRSSPDSLPVAPKAPSAAEPGRDVQIYDWVAFSWIKCDVDWGHSCSGSYLLDASKQGWQACSFLGTQVSKGGWNSSYRDTPTNWYTADPENPDRFRAYHFNISAAGSPYPWHQVGGWIELRNVGVRLIPAWATNYHRYSAQCEMPSHN